jgi:sorbitol-specific phosphotransferase system component IIC
MSDVQQLTQIIEALTIVLAMVDFIGKDDVEQHLRWAAKNYAERIYMQSIVNN